MEDDPLSAPAAAPSSADEPAVLYREAAPPDPETSFEPRRLDDDPVAGPRSLAAALRGAPSASRKVKILRAGALLDLEVETGERV